jgi:hypothetical protein
VILKLVEKILKDNVITVLAEEFRGKFSLGEIALIEVGFLRVDPFFKFFTIDAEVLEPLKMSDCERELIVDLFLLFVL